MRSLIVGATGFLGSHLVQAELNKEHQVYGLGLDNNFPEGCRGHVIRLEDFDALSSCIKDINPDRVYHLAALAAEPGDFDQAQDLYQANIINTVHLLRALIDREFKGRFVLAGSCAVYGHPAAENGLVCETDPVQPVLEYGLTKSMQERIIGFYSRRYEFDFASIRLFNLIGPGEPPRLVTSALCHRAAKARNEINGYLEVGATHTIRDFLDVRDAAKAFVAVMNSNLKGPVNACSGRPISILEVVKKVLKLSGIASHREMPMLKRAWDVPAIYGDDTKLLSTGWREEYDLDISLKTVWNEALENADV